MALTLLIKNWPSINLSMAIVDLMFEYISRDDVFRSILGQWSIAPHQISVVGYMGWLPLPRWLIRPPMVHTVITCCDCRLGTVKLINFLVCTAWWGWTLPVRLLKCDPKTWFCKNDAVDHPGSMICAVVCLKDEGSFGVHVAKYKTKIIIA